jgi:hypothetical protein
MEVWLVTTSEEITTANGGSFFWKVRQNNFYTFYNMNVRM